MNDISNIKKMLHSSPKLYSILSPNLKNELSTDYVEILLKNKSNNSNLIIELSKVKFNNIEKHNIIFNKLEKNLTESQLQELLQEPEFKIFYSNFIKNHKLELSKNNLTNTTNKRSNAIEKGNEKVKKFQKKANNTI